jgi:hypothetical protein
VRLDAQSAIALVQAIAALALFMSAAEWLAARRDFPVGEFTSSDAVTEIGRLAAAAGLLLPLPQRAAACCLVAAATLTYFSHLRRLFGLEGGDQLLLVVLVALLLREFFAPSSRRDEIVLWLIALHAAMAYATAGIAKLSVPGWRSGEYLHRMVRSSLFGHPAAAAALASPSRAAVVSWLLLTFEVGFVAIFWLPPGAELAVLAVGFAFHLANAWLMGLNGFLWAFAATYPAIYFCIGRFWM